MSPSLFDARGEPTAHARATDPTTSHDAARSVKSIRPRQRAVLAVLAERPMTDVELVEVYGYRHRADADRYPRQSESGLRTRRAELVTLGYVEDSTTTRRLESGRRAIVWTTTGRDPE